MAFQGEESQSQSGAFRAVSKGGHTFVCSRFVLASVLAAGISIASMMAGTAVRAGQLNDEQTLYHFDHLALRGLEPWESDRETLLDHAHLPWRWGSARHSYRTTVRSGGKKTCHPAEAPGQTEFLKEGAPDAYAMALAFRASRLGDRDVSLAIEARRLLRMLARTRGFRGPTGEDYSGSNQCVLDLAVSIPIWISTAELLEGSVVWSANDRAAFSDWLADEVYPKVAWASRVRRNNWGAAGSLAARMIAEYVAPDRPLLLEVAPEPRLLMSVVAVREHDAIAFDRVGTSWRGDSQCGIRGIQSHGGIPDELRRGEAGCTGRYIPSARDKGLIYQTMHVELLVMHAEVLRLAGDSSLFEAKTKSGRPALLQAILFVIDNRTVNGRSWQWGPRSGALRIAHRYYGDSRIEAALEESERLGFRGGRIFPYTRIAP